MTEMIRKAGRCEAGATAIEYSMIAGMIALVIIAAVALVGSDVSELLQSLGGAV